MCFCGDAGDVYATTSDHHRVALNQGHFVILFPQVGRQDFATLSTADDDGIIFFRVTHLVSSFGSGLPTTLFHRFDGFVRYPDRVCQKRVVNERCRVTIAPFRVLWPSRSIFYDCDLETLLKQFA